MEERLNKWLGQMGVCSRREADRLIEDGKVLVDGRRAAMGQKVSPGQRVVCNGKVVQGGRDSKPEPVLLVVNKPIGIVCTASGKDRAENIVEFLNYPERIYPVGRLDKDSEGLLLMTNQGDLVNKIMRSGNAHEKEYIVTVNQAVTEDFIRKMSAGVELKELDEVTRPCKVEKVDKKTFSIVLTQGLNRQIRRMCETCGCQVRSLKRVRIMNIRLGTLRSGAYRKVNGREYDELLKLLKESSSLPKMAPGERNAGAGQGRKQPERNAGAGQGRKQPERSAGAGQGRKQSEGNAKASQGRNRPVGNTGAGEAQARKQPGRAGARPGKTRW